MWKKLLPRDILDAIKALETDGIQGVSSSDIHARVGGSYATVGRLLNTLVQTGAIVRTGKARATRYFLPQSETGTRETLSLSEATTAAVSPAWTTAARSVLARLQLPLGAREPVTYQRRFVGDYRPNQSAMLPRKLAEALAQEGRMQGQQPAGTYARKVLEQLLIDLSWSSSRLEGNIYSLLATEELFKSGAAPTDTESVMLLNHKRAIEFMVDAVPTYGLTDMLIRNLHALLMQDLSTDAATLGATREKLVNITDTTYVPNQVPQILDEMLSQIIAKAQLIKNPVEASFFLWVNLAYLQPFEDGNKRTSRLAANVPLMLYNCAPLAFLDVAPQDYAKAMLSVYELLDLRLASELFAWTYRRSVGKYKVVMESMSAPDPFRVQHREQLSEAMQRIVRGGTTLKRVFKAMHLPAEKAQRFSAMLEAELGSLTTHNCARYRLTIGEVQAWIGRGRPF